MLQLATVLYKKVLMSLSTWVGLPVNINMHSTSGPFPGTVEGCCLSIILHAIVLYLPKKYQHTLDILSLGMCPTVITSFTTVN